MTRQISIPRLVAINAVVCGLEIAACVAFTFIPGMEICALKAPKDAATLVHAGLASFLTLQPSSPYCRRRYDLWQA